ncbi:TRAP transporter small permease [Halomonas salipaludis]|uniref:TRAP transporter small permease protein n=1 Tax=Halomonas salipaludis TaxID=2032625 RepID=A0A2A2F061_9GAMM|nr:TRAP transporter small permease [Halomonas salipaludis]PAU78328.1 TRAP transporter permease DctQ [Halomonas salipaludis]
MKVVKWIDEYAEISVCVVLMLMMAALLAVQVFMRYVMGASLSWSEEIARYLFIWLIYLGISFGAREMRHIKIDTALHLFPSFLRPWVVVLGDVLFLIFSLYIVWTSWSVIERQIMLGQTSPAVNVPMWIVYAAPCVGFALTAIRQLQTIYWRLKHPELSQQGEL